MRVGLALIVLALPLSACGSSSDPVAKAATKATAAGSEHIVLTGTATTGGETVRMSGAGDFQSTPKLGAMHMSVQVQGKRIAMDEVLRGWTVYMRSPLFASVLPAGKTWGAVDLRKAGKRFGVDTSQYAQQDPTDILGALRQAGSVKKVGSATVDGVDTTHYRATVHLAKVAGAVPIDVWIDNDDLVRRMKTSYASTSMQMDFSKYGEPVSVQVPSANDTVDMTKLGG